MFGHDSEQAETEEEADAASEDEEDEPPKLEEIKFGKDTLDAVILATYHYFVCGINWNDMLAFGTAFLLHILAFFMKFLIPLLFKIYTIDDQGLPYSATAADRLQKISYNQSISGPDKLWAEEACAGRNHRSAIHILMIFVWFSFLIPELLKIENKLWALYTVKTEAPDEPEPGEEGEEEEPKPATCMELKKKEKEKEDKTSLTLDENGAKCVTKPAEDGKKKEKKPEEKWGKNCLADYLKPEEDKKVGITIKWMSPFCKFTIIFGWVIPDFLLLMYIAWIGLNFIVFESDISVLIFKALVLKGVLKLPSNILATFGGKYLKKYTEKSVFLVDEVILVPDNFKIMWGIWIHPFLKFVIAVILTFIVHFGIFGRVRKLRHACVVILGQGGSLGEDTGGYLNKIANSSGCAVNLSALPNNTCTSYFPVMGKFPFVPPEGSFWRKVR